MNDKRFHTDGKKHIFAKSPTIDSGIKFYFYGTIGVFLLFVCPLLLLSGCKAKNLFSRTVLDDRLSIRAKSKFIGVFHPEYFASIAL